jgi:CheY-like chemotaxis protein
MAAGMVGHIAKPIDIAELKSTLFQQLKGKKEGGQAASC